LEHVDLRWGVATADAAGEEAKGRTEAAVGEKGLAIDVEGMSVTALEIESGVLDSPDQHKVPGRGIRPFSNRYLYEELGLPRLQDRRRMSRLHALT
jgi:hypothetical protein